MTLLQLEAILYYCCLINGGLLLISSAVALQCPTAILRLQSRVLNIPAARLQLLYSQGLILFKVFYIFFNLSPWLALMLMR